MKAASRSLSRFHRRLAVVLTLLVIGAGVPSATAQPAGIAAGEGDWVGFVSFTGAGPTGPAWDFRGSFTFSSNAGELDGAFGWSASDVSMEGIVTGPATMPRFSLTGGTSRGVVLTDVSGGGEIQFTAATCERLEGVGVNWDQVFPGAATITNAVWWAVRDGSATDPGVFFDSVESLSGEIDAIMDSLDAGAAVADVMGRIEPLLTDAERVASTLNRTEGCGLGFYRSVIATEIGRFVEYVLGNPGVGVLLFAQVVLMAVRTGLIGAGAETGGDTIEAQAMAAVAERIQSAIAAGDPIALDILAGLAADLGWDDLEREAILGIVEVGS